MNMISRTIFKNEISGYVVERVGGEAKMDRVEPVIVFSTSKLTDAQVNKIAKKHGFVLPEVKCSCELMEMPIEKFVENASVCQRRIRR